MPDIMNNIPAIGDLTGKLGDLAAGFSVENLMGKAGAYVNGLVAKLVAMIPESVKMLYNTHKVLFLLAAICVLVLVAYEGYRFFKAVTYAGSAFLFGLAGYWYISPMFEANLKPMVPEFIDYHAAVGVVCAVIAVVLCHFAFNLVLLIIGGGAGYLLGTGMVYTFITNYFNTLAFLQNDNVKKVIGGIIAVIVAMVAVLLFKLLFMLLTSFGGMVGAAILLQTILIPAADQTVKYAFIGIGAVLAIAAMVRQHNQENNLVFKI